MKLIESSLSRLTSHMVEHDTGTITAFRSSYTYKENLQRNKQLLAKLFSLGYNVTSVQGVYVEDYGTKDAKEVGEHVFFVVDVKDKGRLEDDLRFLGEEYEQDSVLFIPKPGNESYLWGTNDAEFPGYGKVVKFSHRGMGTSGQFMTKIRGRPFIFESVLKEHKSPDGYLGRMATNAYTKMNWHDIEIED